MLRRPAFFCPYRNAARRSPNHAQPAAVFLLTLPETPLFPQFYGEHRRFFSRFCGKHRCFFPALRGTPPLFLQPCPKCRPLRFFFRTASAPRNRSFFAAAPARRTVARRRSTQNAGGLQGRNFRGIARRSPRVRTGRPTADFPRRGVCCKPFFICPFVF